MNIIIKGWEDWDDVSGSAIDVGEVGSLVGALYTRMTLHDRLDWEATEQQQGNLELKMMVHLWFRAGVSAWNRTELADRLLVEPNREVKFFQKSHLRPKASV